MRWIKYSLILIIIFGILSPVYADLTKVRVRIQNWGNGSYNDDLGIYLRDNESGPPAGIKSCENYFDVPPYKSDISFGKPDAGLSPETILYIITNRSPEPHPERFSGEARLTFKLYRRGSHNSTYTNWKGTLNITFNRSQSEGIQINNSALKETYKALYYVADNAMEAIDAGRPDTGGYKYKWQFLKALENVPVFGGYWGEKEYSYVEGALEPMLLRNEPPHITGITATPNPDTVAPNANIIFKAEGYDNDGSIAKSIWDFGDNNTEIVSGQSVNHTYDTAGNYTIQAAVIDNYGDTSEYLTYQQKIKANDPPIIESTEAIAGSDHVPDTVIFKGNAIDPDGHIIKYEWDFDGDGVYDYSSSETAYITKYYPAPDGVTLNPKLRVTDNKNFTTTANANQIVLQSNQFPIAAFNASPLEGRVSADVHFRNTSYDPDRDSISYKWDFGDGQTSEEKNPQHTFSIDAQDLNRKTFTVKLEVTDEYGAVSQTPAIGYITVTPNMRPEADFNAAPEEGRISVRVHFTNLSNDKDNDNPLTYQWDFGDGTTSTMRNPIHTFEIPGTQENDQTFNVTLMVFDSLGAPSLIPKVKTIKVIANKKPIANFTAEPMIGRLKFKVDFTNASYDAESPGDLPLSYEWDFGNGEISTRKNPKNILFSIPATQASAQLFPVKLIVKDSLGMQSEPYIVNIKVEPNIQPVTKIETDPDPPVGRLTLDVTFTETHSDEDGEVVWQGWDMDNDGIYEIENQPSVSRHYESPGNYTVKSKVIDNEGGIGISSVTAVVSPNHPPIISSISATPNPADMGQSIYFEGRYYDPDGVVVTKLWDFGDGASSYGDPVSHSYSRAGHYTARLSVQDNDGAWASNTINITILEAIGTIRVHVTKYNKKGEIVNAQGISVTISGPVTQSKTTGWGASSGLAVFYNVPTGTYTVSAVIPSPFQFYSTTVHLSSGQTIEVHLGP